MGPPMLLGRDEERATLNGLIDAAGEGLSGALVLHGEAGMGKTTLMDYAVETASTLQVTRIAGIEAERDLSYAALHRLLQPSLDRLSNLPRPQRDGLSSALGLASHEAADPFLIGLATLTLLADPRLSVVSSALSTIASGSTLSPYRRLRSPPADYKPTELSCYLACGPLLR